MVLFAKIKTADSIIFVFRGGHGRLGCARTMLIGFLYVCMMHERVRKQQIHCEHVPIHAGIPLFIRISKEGECPPK